MLPPYLPCALGQSMAEIRAYSATYCQDIRSDCQESLVQSKTISTLHLPTLREPTDLSKHRLCEEWLYLLEPSLEMAASCQQHCLGWASGESSHATLAQPKCQIIQPSPHLSNQALLLDRKTNSDVK